jgi:hypothetical protein
MPRSKRPRVSKVIIMPTLKFKKVAVPKGMSSHSSASYVSKAHTFIKRVYGQLTRPRYRTSGAEDIFKPKSFKYIGRMKRLNEGMYHGPKVFYTGRTSIPPVKPKNPTKVHPRTGVKGQKYKIVRGLTGYLRSAA